LEMRKLMCIGAMTCLRSQSSKGWSSSEEGLGFPALAESPLVKVLGLVLLGAIWRACSSWNTKPLPPAHRGHSYLQIGIERGAGGRQGLSSLWPSMVKSYDQQNNGIKASFSPSPSNDSRYYPWQRCSVAGLIV
jgi:hypothetical protein